MLEDAGFSRKNGVKIAVFQCQFCSRKNCKLFNLYILSEIMSRKNSAQQGRGVGCAVFCGLLNSPYKECAPKQGNSPHHHLRWGWLASPGRVGAFPGPQAQGNGTTQHRVREADFSIPIGVSQARSAIQSCLRRCGRDGKIRLTSKRPSLVSEFAELINRPFGSGRGRQ